MLRELIERASIKEPDERQNRILRDEKFIASDVILHAGSCCRGPQRVTIHLSGGYLFRCAPLGRGESLMPKRTVKDVSTIVRDYFDSVKKSKFIFDVLDVSYDEGDDEWSVECQVSNVFKESPITYLVSVDDESGEIVEVEAQEE